MKPVIIVSKHHVLAARANTAEILDYSGAPEVDVMPIGVDDFTAPTIGYCALSLGYDGDTYKVEKVVGFVTQKETLEYQGRMHDKLRHLTVLPGWQKTGLARSLVARATRALIQSGHGDIAAIANGGSEQAFASNGYLPVGQTIGQTGLEKTIYIYGGGQMQAKPVECR